MITPRTDVYRTTEGATHRKRNIQTRSNEELTRELYETQQALMTEQRRGYNQDVKILALETALKSLLNRLTYVDTFPEVGAVAMQVLGELE
jgi:hypothetical protein